MNRPSTAPARRPAPARGGGRAFLPIWTLAIAATASAFVVHLALRGRTVQLGYELGRTHQEQARLREVKRVLEVEAASYKTPERVEIIGRTLLGMEVPPPERVVLLSSSPGQSGDGVATTAGEGPP